MGLKGLFEKIKAYLIGETVMENHFRIKIKKVDEYIQLLKDDKQDFMKLVKNFIKKGKKLPGFEILELLFVPYSKNNSMEQYYFKSAEFSKEELESSYIQTCEWMYNYYLKPNYYKEIVHDLYEFKTNYFKYDCSEIVNRYNLDEIMELYESLIHEEIILYIEDIHYLEAFIFIIYELYKQETIKITEQKLKKVDSSLDDEYEDIVEKLYLNGYDKCEIIEIMKVYSIYSSEKSSQLFMSCDEDESMVEDVIKSLKKQQYINNLRKDSKEDIIRIEDIDLMSGYDFEKFIAKLFRKMGYKAYVTQESNDQGVDVIAEKSGTKVAIQTKCYNGSVGNKAIQEIVAGMKYYEAEKAMVITNSIFTKSAIELAKKNNVQLWDRKTLIEKIEEVM